MDFTSGLLIVLGSIAFLILLFLILRSLTLWYWKIDKIVDNLEKQNQRLESIDSRMSHISAMVDKIYIDRKKEGNQNK